MNLTPKLIVVFLVLSIVPLALVGYLAFVDGRQAIDEVVFNRLVTTTQLKEAEFSAWLNDSQTDLQALAIQPDIQHYAAILASEDTSSEEQQAAYDQLHALLVPYQAIQSNFDSIILIRASDGLIMVATKDSYEGKYRKNETFSLKG